MRATFSGFEAIKKALMASQMSLDVTSQNVANIHTDGYTRQRVDVTSIAPDSSPTKYANTNKGLIGQGVEITGVSQTRDQFLDSRYRKNNADAGKWDAKLSITNDIEDVLDEVLTDGLSKSLTDYYTALQNFSANAETVEYATTFRSAAKKVVEIFNQYSNQLADIKDEQVYNCGADVDKVNESLEQLAHLNKEIKSDSVRGVTSNELLDSRNVLLDNLSNLVGINYRTESDGQVSVKLGDDYLLDSQKGNSINKLTLDSTGESVKINFENGAKANITSGVLEGCLEGLNGKGVFADTSNPAESTTNGIAFYQKSIDMLAKAFGENFNTINDSTGAKKLFVGDGAGNITAANIKLSQDWLSNPQFIKTDTDVAPGATPTQGKNGNLLLMLQSMDAKKSVTPYFSGTFEEYSVSIMGELATDVKYSKEMASSAKVDLKSIANQRESIMGVSTDEESVNMVKYQKSYNAAARLMTVLDEMLDTLINRTGIVGR